MYATLVKTIIITSLLNVLTSVEHQRSPGTNEHGHGPRPAAGPRRARRVHGDVRTHGESEPPVPGRALHPVDRVEERRGAAVAGVGAVHPLHVRVAGVGEEFHQHGFDRLGLVDDGLGADLHPPHLVVAGPRLLHQPLDHGQTQTVDVLPVAAEAHPGLAEAHRVLSRRYAVKSFQLGLE